MSDTAVRPATMSVAIRTVGLTKRYGDLVAGRTAVSLMLSVRW